MPPNENKNEGCFLRGLQWLSLKMKLLEDGATPPNWGYLMLTFAGFFSVQFCNNIVLPFMPAMVVHLGRSENEKGTYVGLLTSCLYTGTVVGSMFWGWIADNKGRKIVLVLSAFFLGLSVVAFGFSASIPMALAMKFCLGLANGMSTTCRAVLYDVSDTSNQAIGMVLLALGWGVASMLASFIGGYLSEPCSRWPDFCDEDSILGQFPFLLPCIIPGVVACLLGVFLFFKFQETLVKAETHDQEVNVEDTGSVDHFGSKTSLSVVNPTRNGRPVYQRSCSQSSSYLRSTPVHSFLSRSTNSLNPGADINTCLGKDMLERRDSCLEREQNDISDHLGKRKITNDAELGSSSDIESDKESSTCVLESITVTEFPTNSLREGEKVSNGVNVKQPEANAWSQRKNSDFGIKERNLEPLLEENVTDWEEDHICGCCDQCFKLGCTSCKDSSLHKLLRLSDVWASVSMYFMLCFATVGTEDIIPVFVSTPSDSGGLGFSTSEIGTALGLIALPLLVLQIKIYTFLVSKLRVRRTYLLGSFICLLGAQTLPMLTSLNNSSTWLWIILITNQTLFRLSANCCFSSVFLLINNSVPQHLAGQVNGLSMATSCIGRALAPIAAGSVYSWSVAEGQFIGAPFDTGFSFFLMGIIFGVSLIQCLIINPNLEKQKK